MSKQSEAKEEQGYTKKLPTCSTCLNFKMETVPSAWNDKYLIEKNLRCKIGKFKVMKTATCKRHEFKIR